MLVGSKGGERDVGWVVDPGARNATGSCLYSESPQELDEKWLRFALEE